MKTKYTRKMLETAVERSISFAQVIRLLGLKQSGGNHSHIKNRIVAFGIDTSHFLGQKANAYLKHSGSFRKKPPEEVLVKRDHGGRREAYQLRDALIASGKTYCCEICNLPPMWNGMKLTIQVDHINGNWLDDRIDNLRFMCPNCHSQTPNFGGKSGTRIKSQNNCIDCLKKISKRSTHCKSCARKRGSTKIDWPDVDGLIKMVRESNYSAVARTLGVTDNAVRKRIRNHS